MSQPDRLAKGTATLGCLIILAALAFSCTALMR